MADFIGRVSVPEIAPSGLFPFVSSYPHGRAEAFSVVTHQFGSANAKIEQRFLLGAPARRWTFRADTLTPSSRATLRAFWDARKGAYQPFTYGTPNEDGSITDRTVIFENAPLTLEQLESVITGTGITFVEIPDPADAPEYTVSETCSRFPSEALETALLDQAQELIPLIRIRVKESGESGGVPDIYLSDRRCTVDGQEYLPRLLELPEVGQTLVTGRQGESAADQVRFVFGNADGVMVALANDTDLLYARIEFSLYHVGSGIKLDLWAGEVYDWARDGDGAEFVLSASDDIRDVTLPYPNRRISRQCWKTFKDGAACPYVGADTTCDKGFATANGCQSHGMDNYFGGIVAQPQGVNLRHISMRGLTSRQITTTSQVSDTIYGEALADIWHNEDADAKKALPVECKIASGREEDEFYDALGIIGAGPLGQLTTPQMVDWDGDGTAEKFVGHTLDGQPHHGYGTANPTYGLRTSLGPDPNTEPFSLGDGVPWQTYGPERAAGVAFIELRRMDEKGIQPTRIAEHSLQAMVSVGLTGFFWEGSGPYTRNTWPGLTDPFWIACNTLIRAKGLQGAEAAVQEALFDVGSVQSASAIAASIVDKIVGAGTETQFRFKGVIGETKPLRDWISDILACALGYYTWAFGRLKVGIRSNSSAVEAFTIGNILHNSLRLAPLKPGFEKLIIHFADEEYAFQANTVEYCDTDHAALYGRTSAPLTSEMNLAGVATKSQAARIAITRTREELGGITAAEWKAAREIAFKTTVLALAVEPGMVCSLTHADMPSGAGEFRVTGWRLNKDYSIDITGRTTTDSMYDYTIGPKPADVAADPVPGERDLVRGTPAAPNVTAATAEAYYCDADGAETTTGRYYGFKGTITLPRAHADYSHLRVVRIFATDPAPSTRRTCVLDIYAPDFTADEISWKTSHWPRPAASETFQAVEFVCENGDTRQTANPYTVEDVAVIGQTQPPALPVSVSCSDRPEERYLDDVNLTHTFLYPTATLPANHRALWITWWISKDGGSNYGWLGKTAVGETAKFDQLAPHTAENWKVKAATGSDAGDNSPDDAVESAAFEVTGLSAVPAEGATSITNASASYTVDYDVCPWAFYPVISCVAPTDPNFWHTQLRVKLYNAAGELSPDPIYAGDGQVAGEWTNQGTQTYTEPLGWMLPPMDEPASGFRYFRLYWYAKTRAGQWTLCNAWSDSFPAHPSYGELVVTENRRSDPPGAGLTLGTDGKVKLGTDNLANMVLNPGFEDGVTHWTLAPAAYVAEGAQWAHSGAKLLVLYTSADAAWADQRWSCAPGQTYYAEVWAHCDGGALGLYLEFIGQDGTTLSSTMVDSYAEVSDWHKLSGSATAPAGTSTVRLLILCVGENVAWFIDDVYLSKVKTASEMLLGSGLVASGEEVTLDLGDGLKFTGSKATLNTSDGLKLEGGMLKANLGDGLEISGGAVQANLGNGLTTALGAITLNLGPGLAMSGAAVVANLGNGLTTFGGAITLNLGNGLAMNGSVVQVNAGPGVSVAGGSVTLTTGNGVTISGGVVQANLGNGVTLSSGAITLNLGAGLTLSGAAATVNAGGGLTLSGIQLVIAQNGVTSDQILSLAVSKLATGTMEVGSGGLTFSGSGGIALPNGGNIGVSPGYVSAAGGVFVRSAGVGWEMTAGLPARLTYTSATAVVNASTFQIAGTNVIDSARCLRNIVDLDMTGWIYIDSVAVLKGQMSSVTAPSGGSVIDTECRAAVTSLINALKAVGLMA